MSKLAEKLQKPDFKNTKTIIDLIKTQKYEEALESIKKFDNAIVTFSVNSESILNLILNLQLSLKEKEEIIQLKTNLIIEAFSKLNQEELNVDSVEKITEAIKLHLKNRDYNFANIIIENFGIKFVTKESLFNMLRNLLVGDFLGKKTYVGQNEGYEEEYYKIYNIISKALASNKINFSDIKSTETKEARSLTASVKSYVSDMSDSIINFLNRDKIGKISFLFIRKYFDELLNDETFMAMMSDSKKEVNHEIKLNRIQVQMLQALRNIRVNGISDTNKDSKKTFDENSVINLWLLQQIQRKINEDGNFIKQDKAFLVELEKVINLVENYNKVNPKSENYQDLPELKVKLEVLKSMYDKVSKINIETLTEENIIGLLKEGINPNWYLEVNGHNLITECARKGYFEAVQKITELNGSINYHSDTQHQKLQIEEYAKNQSSAKLIHYSSPLHAVVSNLTTKQGPNIFNYFLNKGIKFETEYYYNSENKIPVIFVLAKLLKKVELEKLSKLSVSKVKEQNTKKKAKNNKRNKDKTSEIYDKIIDELFNTNQNIFEVCDSISATIMHHAAKYGNHILIKKLDEQIVVDTKNGTTKSKYNTSIDSYDSRNNTVLHYAVSKIFSQKVNFRNLKETIDYLAKNFTEKSKDSKLALDKEFINKKNSQDKSAIEIVFKCLLDIQKGEYANISDRETRVKDILKILLDNKAVMPYVHDTLYAAIYINDLNRVKTILSDANNLNALTEDNKFDLLKESISLKSTEITRLLINDFKFKYKEKGSSQKTELPLINKYISECNLNALREILKIIPIEQDFIKFVSSKKPTLTTDPEYEKYGIIQFELLLADSINKLTFDYSDSLELKKAISTKVIAIMTLFDHHELTEEYIKSVKSYIDIYSKIPSATHKLNLCEGLLVKLVLKLKDAEKIRECIKNGLSKELAEESSRLKEFNDEFKDYYTELETIFRIFIKAEMTITNATDKSKYNEILDQAFNKIASLNHKNKIEKPTLEGARANILEERAKEAKAEALQLN